MKLNLARVWTALLLVFSFLSCSRDTLVGPPLENNLILNPSFEFYGLPSMIGWEHTPDDTSLVHIFADAPPTGGTYSLGLEAVWGSNIVTAKVPALEGFHRYRLSVWARSTGIDGSVSLYLRTSGSFALRKTLQLPETTWTKYTLLDTIATTVGDSLFVSLSAGVSQLLSGQTLFDLCILEDLGPKFSANRN